MTSAAHSHNFSLLKKQLGACAAFGLLLASILAALYLQHRQREWVLRCEQAKYRLDIAFELVSREVERVRSDATYLANRAPLRKFVSGDQTGREELESDFMLFVQQKRLYDQVRVLGLDGYEKIRVNFDGQSASAVPSESLQDKSDRYYFQAASSLNANEIFVSDFDLNIEHGAIEKPLKPVIRFVTPVADDGGEVRAFVVLNFLGEDLLKELVNSTIPGETLLLRSDGEYIRGLVPRDAWGWLLGHGRTFSSQFPTEWNDIDYDSKCRLSTSGAFASRLIPLGRVAGEGTLGLADASGGQALSSAASAETAIIVVSYLARQEVFKASNDLLKRLFVLSAGVFALAIVFTRAWARATWSRQQQASRIAASEERLRELSSRLLRIQEDERRAISREIHDELGQQATAINLDIKLALRNIETGRAASHLQRAVEENETLLRTLHEFAQRVRPAVLDDLGLADAIETHLADFEVRTGVKVQLDVRLPADIISDEIADNTFRLVQESLNNVAKHAEATKVSVELSVADSDSRKLQISIRDNGHGNVSEGQSGGLGLIGMRERVDLLGGEMTLDSSPNDGTSIEIGLPLAGSARTELQ